MTDEVEITEEQEPAADPIGSCKKCGEPIHEHEPRIEDKRGVWHPGCYKAK